LAITITLNGIDYDIPQTGDVNWGAAVTNWIVAANSSFLTTNGGTFALTSDLDLGNTYGLETLFVRDKSALPATTGFLRMGNGAELCDRDWET